MTAVDRPEVGASEDGASEDGAGATGDVTDAVDVASRSDPVVAVTGGALRPWALLRSTPAAVWAMVVLLALLAGVYTTAVPLLHAPDEHAHIDLVLTEPHVGLDPYDGAELSNRTLAAIPLVDLVPVDWRVAPLQPWAGLDGADALPRESRPTYAQLAPAGDSGILNNARNHPPLYYLGMSRLLTAVRTLAPGGDAWSWDQTFGALRALNVLLVAPLPFLAFWTAVRLTRRRRIGLTAAAVTLAVPMLAHSGGAVNNDNLLALLSAALLLALAWVWSGDTGLRTAAIVGVIGGLAMLTKIFGLPAPLWIGAAYAVAWLRTGRLGRAAAGLGVAAVATIVAGGWWDLRLIITEGTPAPRGFEYTAPAAFEIDYGYWLAEFADRITTTFWGHFGVEQFPLPTIVVAAATVILLTLVLAGTVRGPWAALRHRWAEPVLLALPTLTTLAMVVYAAWGGYARSGIPSGIHGRYLFLGLTGIAVLAATGLHAVIDRRLVPLAVLGAAGLMQALGLWTIVTGFWAGDGMFAQLDSLVDWSPWPPRWVALGWALTGLAGVTVAWLLARTAAHDPPAAT